MEGKTTLALIDDHSLLRNGLAGLIATFECFEVIIEADNGKDFLKQLTTYNTPDIILLDITMPIMNGYETAAWIREHLPFSKVLVLSMMENDTAIIRMLKLGARGYILKDSQPLQFKEALQQVRDHGYFMNEVISNKMFYTLSQEINTNNASSRIPLINLSEREMQFLKWACTEKTYKEIAQEMFVSPRTVDSYRDALFEKLGASSRVGLVLYAIKNGIVSI